MHNLVKFAGGDEKDLASRFANVFKGLSVDEISRGLFLIPSSIIEHQIKEKVKEVSDIESISLDFMIDHIVALVKATKYTAAVCISTSFRIDQVLFSKNAQRIVMACDSDATKIKGLNLVGSIGVALAESLLLKIINDETEKALNKGVNPEVIWPKVEVDLSDNPILKKIKDYEIMGLTAFDIVSFHLHRQDQDGVWIKIKFFDKEQIL